MVHDGGEHVRGRVRPRVDQDQTASIFDHIDRNRLDDFTYPHHATRRCCRETRTGARSSHRARAEHAGPVSQRRIRPWVGGALRGGASGRDARPRQRCLSMARLSDRAGRDHEWEFNEWFHGITGETWAGATDQCWSAGDVCLRLPLRARRPRARARALENDETQLLHNRV